VQTPAGADPSTRPRIRVGVDIVGVDRVARLVTENAGILETLFTGRELSYCLGKRRCYEHMAVRFAAKEAVLKAFGTGLGQRMRWTDVEVVNEVSGRPRVSLYGEVAAWARRRGLADLDVSLSHTAGLAIAQAVAVWDQANIADPPFLTSDTRESVQSGVRQEESGTEPGGDRAVPSD
jgi:holo-[acyl-carrier protein] synthase